MRAGAPGEADDGVLFSEGDGLSAEAEWCGGVKGELIQTPQKRES